MKKRKISKPDEVTIADTINNFLSMLPPFIYFVNLDDFLVCHNLSVTKKLTCASIAHIESFKEEHPLYKIDPDKLISEVNSLKTFSTPRLTNIMLACWHKNGLKIGIGKENTKYYSKGEIDKIVKVAEVEIEFEKARRAINSNLPSRLMCLFLAEDSIDGKLMLRNMFYDTKKNFYIVPVKVKYALRFHRADSRWIEIYERTRDQKVLESYWRGDIVDNNPEFEYLVDGQIELVNDSDKEDILKDYTSRHIPKMKHNNK